MIHRDIEQGSDAWFDIKRGKISATGIAKIQAGGKGKTRDKYETQIVLERLTGTTAPTYSSAAMDRGVELEDVARQLYEQKTMTVVEQVGFIDHPFILNYGVSPDGLVGEDGMVEIKCVEPQTMLDYINDRGIPTNYQKQMQSQMCVADKQWNDFCAYCPEMPENLQLLIIRLDRDQAAIDEQNVDIVAFDAAVTAKVEQLREVEL